MRQKISPFCRDSVLDRISNRKFQQISALQSQKSHTRPPTANYTGCCDFRPDSPATRPLTSLNKVVGKAAVTKE